MGKINFTREHQVALYNKATTALFNKQVFKGNTGTEYTIHDLLHNGYSTISLGYAGLYECVKYYLL